jgi:hypothetical protein
MRVVGISLLLVLTASVAIATFEILPEHRVTPENMEEHGISVHVLVGEPARCFRGISMWVQIPLSVSAAALTVRESSGAVTVRAELAIRELPKNPTYRSGYVPPGMDAAPPHLIEKQDRFSFLVDGFRGVSFCLASTSLESARLDLTSDQPFTSWWLAPLSQWSR